LTYLLKANDIGRIVPGDENALIQASANGHLQVVRLLVSRRAVVNARVWIQSYPSPPNGKWRTALSMAREKSYKSVVESCSRSAPEISFQVFHREINA
jgi:hypothetical protein